MSILFDSPIPYESISEGRRKEQALGGQLAKNMMDSYFQATRIRAQEEQWAEERPLREAQITSMAARAESEKLDSQLKSLQLINETRKKDSIAGLAAIQEEAALNGWDNNSRGKLYNFISRHPEFAGSKEVAAVEDNFEKAAKARDIEEEWRTREATRLSLERMRIDAKTEGGAFEPNVWQDPKTGNRFAISEGGALVPLKDTDVGTADPILGPDGKQVPGLWNVEGRVVRVPVDVLGGGAFTTPTTTNSVGAAGAKAADKVYDYDANGKRITK